MIEPLQKDLDLYQSGRLAGAIQGNQQRLSRMAGGKVARTGGKADVQINHDAGFP